MRMEGEESLYHRLTPALDHAHAALQHRGGAPWGVATFASCRLCQGRFGRGHGWDGDYWPPQALPLLV